MIPENIKAMLEKKEQPDNIVKLKDYLLRCLKRSRDGMSKHYKKWDRNLDVYKGKRDKDEEDIEAEELGEPIKSIIPMSYAQVQTFVAFAFLLLKQNNTFYSFPPNADEDYPLNEPNETLLERDLRKNKWDSKLYQFLLDITRFGMAVTIEYWTKETMKIEVPMEEQAMFLDGLTGVQGPTSRTVDAIKFEGNKIDNVSPYLFFPDLRLPLTRWQEGQFCAHECEYNIGHLRQMEKDGTLAGTEFIEKMDETTWKERDTSRLPGLRKEMGSRAKDKDDSDFMVCLTHFQVKLVPKEYGLGPENYVKDMIVRIANDGRIVGCEPAGYLHGEFVYNVAQLSPDMHSALNESLSDVINALQDVITWLINARILAVRNSLENHLVVDPAVVDMTDVEARSPIIKMMKGAPRTGVNNFVQQLRINDHTVGHFDNAESLMKVMQVVTGVNENAMGQYSPGRRSATENRAANAGAASRMKMQVQLMFSDALAPQGLKMLTNMRQGMSEETFVKILGETRRALYAVFHPSDPTALVGQEDFLVFDATLASEKGFVAQSLQELLITMVNNPEVMVATGFDLPAALKELQYLRGVNNATRFFKSSAGVPPGTVQPTIPGSTSGAVPALPAAPVGPPQAAIPTGVA